MLLPMTAIGRCSMLEASTRSSGCRRTATSRVSPVGSTQSPTSTPANATRSACAASPTEMPSVLARPRSSSIFSSSFGSCSDRPTSTAPGIVFIFSMKSLVIAMQAARVGAGELDLHRLPHAVVQVVDHDVLGADQLRQQLAQVDSRSRRRALALVALADVDVDAPAAGVDGAVGRLRLRDRARELGGLLDLELGVLEARRGRRAHVDRDGAVVGRRQEGRAADRELQHERADEGRRPRSPPSTCGGAAPTRSRCRSGRPGGRTSR